MPWLSWWLFSLRIWLGGGLETPTSQSTSNSRKLLSPQPNSRPEIEQLSETPESERSLKAGLQQWTPCVAATMSALLLFGCASKPSVVATCPPPKAPPSQIMQPPSTLEFPALYEMLEAYLNGRPPK